MKLPLLLDQHVPSQLHSLASAKEGGDGVTLESVYVREVDELGSEATDEEILEYADRERLFVVTNDDDFRGEVPDGVCVMVYPSQTVEGWELEKIIRAVCDHIESPEDLRGEVVDLTRDWLSE